MTVKYHFSVNGPNRELLGVQAEGEGDNIYSEFRAGIQDVGLESVYLQVSEGGVMAGAIAAATAITAPAPQAFQRASGYAGGAPAAVPQVPGVAVRSCAHGARTRRTGNNSRGAWVGHFCPSPKGTPDQCAPEFE